MIKDANIGIRLDVFSFATRHHIESHDDGVHDTFNGIQIVLHA